VRCRLKLRCPIGSPFAFGPVNALAVTGWSDCPPRGRGAARALSFRTHAGGSEQSWWPPIFGARPSGLPSPAHARHGSRDGREYSRRSGSA